MEWPVWIEYLTSLSHLLLTLNGSTTVFIYLLKHRAIVVETVCPSWTFTAAEDIIQQVMVMAKLRLSLTSV